MFHAIETIDYFHHPSAPLLATGDLDAVIRSVVTGHALLSAWTDRASN
jgi:hypothetical protein